MSGLALVKGKAGYSLQVDGKREDVRRLIFSTSLPLTNSIKKGIADVQSRLASFGVNDFSGKELFETATYTLKNPGKMLRPALVFVGAHMLGEGTDAFIDIATAAELIHSASLVHDDIIDKDTVRRGAASLHARYGQEAALLAGDALIAKGVSLAAAYGPRVVKRVADASLDMCSGELMDYSYRKGGKVPSVREYLKIAKSKSGEFMGACASVAAVYRRDRIAGRLHGFGVGLGIAFQIRDDIIEVTDSNERRRNGGSAAHSLNLIAVLEHQFGIGRKAALAQAADLNNYFANSAVGCIEGEAAAKDLTPYVDFIRIKTG